MLETFSRPLRVHRVDISIRLTRRQLTNGQTRITQLHDISAATSFESSYNYIVVILIRTNGGESIVQTRERKEREVARKGLADRWNKNTKKKKKDEEARLTYLR